LRLALLPPVQALQQAHRLGLSDAALLLAISDAYASLGRWSEARPPAARAAGLGGGPGARARLAQACLELGDPATAREQLAAARAELGGGDGAAGSSAAGVQPGDRELVSRLEARLRAVWPGL
jgi:hypothetical protein